MALAPNPGFPETSPTVYEEKFGVNAVRRGPLRFEEGVATDTDVPNDFTTGAMSGYATAPGRLNHNAVVWIKPPQETMRARAHVGSSSWVEAPTFLNEFAHGSFSDFGTVEYEQVVRSGARVQRVSPSVVDD